MIDSVAVSGLLEAKVFNASTSWPLNLMSRFGSLTFVDAYDFRGFTFL